MHREWQQPSATLLSVMTHGEAKVIKKIHGHGTKILPIENSCQ